MNHKGKTNNRNGKGIKQPEKKGHGSQQLQTKGKTALSLNDYIEEFTQMFPDYKQLTKEEIVGIFAEYNNDFTAVVNSVINGTIRTKPPESWTDVASKKKKKVQTTNQRNAKGRSDENRTDNRTQNRGPRNRQDQPRTTTNSSRPNTREPNANQTSSSQTTSETRPTQAAANLTRPAGATSSVPNSTATSTVPSNTSASSQLSAPAQSSQSSSSTHSLIYNLGSPSDKPSATPTPTAPAPSSSFARTTLSYANIAKSRQPWSPHSQAASAATSSTVSSTLESEPSKAVSGEEVKPQTTATPTEPTPVQTKQTLAPETGSSQSAQKQQATPSASTQQKDSTLDQHAPVRSANVSLPPKVSPLENTKPRVGVILPGGFGSSVDDSLQFQFGNLGISYDEELEQSTQSSVESEQHPAASSTVSTGAVSGSNVSQQKAPQTTVQQQSASSNLSVPAAAQQNANTLPHSVQQPQQQQHSQPDYPENLSPIHGSNEGENVMPHMSYVPNQFMHQPFPFDGAPDNSRPPVGHYFEPSYPTGVYPRDAKYSGGRQSGNQNYVARDSKNFNSQDSANPANSQTSGQNPSAGPNQGYPYPSIYPYGPFMGQFPSAYSTSQFHYQPTLRYYPKGFHNFGNYPSTSGMGYPEDEFSKGVYSSIPQQPGSYYMQPEITNPSLNRDSKPQSNPQSGASKQQASGQQSGKPASPSFVSNPQDQGNQNPNSNAAPNFKASGNASDAYSYPAGRESPYGINSNFTQPYFIPPPVTQAQPNPAPYQTGNRNY